MINPPDFRAFQDLTEPQKRKALDDASVQLRDHAKRMHDVTDVSSVRLVELAQPPKPIA